VFSPWRYSGIQVAQLALKHRQNKKQQQEAIGKKLKRINVALDIVDFEEFF